MLTIIRKANPVEKYEPVWWASNVVVMKESQGQVPNSSPTETAFLGRD